MRLDAADGKTEIREIEGGHNAGEGKDFEPIKDEGGRKRTREGSKM